MIFFQDLEHLVDEIFSELRSSEFERTKAITDIESLPRYGQSLLREYLESSICRTKDDFYEIVDNVKRFCNIRN
ncbi:hypothetical protein DRQ29_01355 [bacterium]|nr:MAG: hypothetical protein DRQ29_01355 [bacterium]